MQINETLKGILRTRHYLVSTDQTDEQNSAYLNAYLFANFGIVVDKPDLLTKTMVGIIDKEFHLNVPKSFYNNPQDTALFSTSELLIEQLVSYFAYGSDLGRIEIFKKDFPEYVVGDELKLRNFYIVSEQEAEIILGDILDNLCAYTRPFSLDELSEFVTLFEAGFYRGTEVKCKDNIISLLDIDVAFARFLDKKDIVKMSVKAFGECSDFNQLKKTPLFKESISMIASCIP